MPTESHDKVCPTCGTCPTCGAKKAQPVPYWPQWPYGVQPIPYIPVYPQPWITWTTNEGIAPTWTFTSRVPRLRVRTEHKLGRT